MVTGLSSRLRGAAKGGSSRCTSTSSQEGTGAPGGREGSEAEKSGGGWAGPGALADGEQVGGDRGLAGKGAAARWRAECANRAAASWARRTVRTFGLGTSATRAWFSVQGHLTRRRALLGEDLEAWQGQGVGDLEQTYGKSVEPEAGVCGQGAGGLLWRTKTGTLRAVISGREQGGSRLSVGKVQRFSWSII